MEFFTSDLTAGGVILGTVALLIISLVTGLFVPRRSVRDLLAVMEARLVEQKQRGDDYKEAWELEVTGKAVQTAQVESLLVTGETIRKFIDAMPPPNEGREGTVGT